MAAKKEVVKNVFRAIGRMGGKLTAPSVFKRAKRTVAKRVFEQAADRDILLQGARYIGTGAGYIGTLTRHQWNKFTTNRAARRSMLGAVPKPPSKSRTRASIVGRGVGKLAWGAAKTVAGGTILSVGAAGMLSIGIMGGINNASKDIILERYMADQRFSRDILLQSRVGLSMGTNQMNRLGSTMGLSNALSRTRHGARY